MPDGANVNHYGVELNLYSCQKKARIIFLFTFAIHQI